MGTCVCQKNEEDVILMYDTERKPEDCSGNSIDVFQNRESINSEVMDVIITKNSPSARVCFIFNDNELPKPNTPQVRKVDLSDEIPASFRHSLTCNKISLSLFDEPKKRTPDPAYISRRFSTDSSSFGNNRDEVHRMIDENTTPRSSTCSTSVDDIFDWDTNYCRDQKICSFDGLNMKPTDRYDIGMEILKATVHNGANPDRMTTHGDRSALMFAVLANDLSFIKSLVAMGVDVNHTNQMGETALSLASEAQRDDIANYLRLHGAMDSVAKKVV